MADDLWKPPSLPVAVDLVIFTLRDSCLQVLLVERGVEPFRGSLALPGGFLAHDREDLLAAAHRELAEEAGLTAEQVHLEHLGVYGDTDRDPRGRILSLAYLAIAPRLPEPVAGTDAADAWWIPTDRALSPESSLAFDHRRIIIDGIERVRNKLEDSALATAFCPPVFTISELQEVYEAVWGVRLDLRNFYRKVQSVDGFIVAAGPTRRTVNGRPARLFRPGPHQKLHPPMSRPTNAAAIEREEQ
ncbi:NUDIX domain-containing protein [Actinoplanes philippinensis]|uniref:NUDIX domain-containing protein n=1 Tax=Actinoplanes philippinensis TaxID=35752 RepID=UPI0033DAECB8